MKTTTTLALPAPARFKLNRSFRVPDVGYWSRELDRRRRFYAYRNEHDRKAALREAEAQIDFATFVAAYVGQHDCNPKLIEKRERSAWGERSAIYQVEDSIYRVRVSMGRFARGMYGKNGHHWHLYVQREGTDRRSIDGDRCDKSAGLGASAVRAHLFGKWCALRGLKESQK